LGIFILACKGPNRFFYSPPDRVFLGGIVGKPVLIVVVELLKTTSKMWPFFAKKHVLNQTTYFKGNSSQISHGAHALAHTHFKYSNIQYSRCIGVRFLFETPQKTE